MDEILVISEFALFQFIEYC